MEANYPDPEAWPECPSCGAAYVLRRCMTFGDGFQYRWLWQRDCRKIDRAATAACKKAQPVLAHAQQVD